MTDTLKPEYYVSHKTITHFATIPDVNDTISDIRQIAKELLQWRKLEQESVEVEAVDDVASVSNTPNYEVISRRLGRYPSACPDKNVSCTHEYTHLGDWLGEFCDRCGAPVD